MMSVAHYTKMKPLLTRLWAEGEEDIKAKEEKSRANFEKMMAEWEAEQKKKKKCRHRKEDGRAGS
jgi:hypothetical protein